MYVAVSLADPKQRSVSKVTTHLHCSHGHHIYHLLHGTHWLANQRGIAHGDVRRAQRRRPWEHGSDAAAVALSLAGTWGKHGIRSSKMLTDRKINGVSIARANGGTAWGAYQACPLAWWCDIPSQGRHSRCYRGSDLCILEIGPSSCFEGRISSDWVVGIQRGATERATPQVCVRIWASVYVTDVLTDMSKVIGLVGESEAAVQNWSESSSACNLKRQVCVYVCVLINSTPWARGHRKDLWVMSIRHQLLFCFPPSTMEL